MLTCTVCNGEDFIKHAGFMYCAVCQTQSQEYQEQEYDYENHIKNVVRPKKSRAAVKKSCEQTFYDDGLWTTWEGFNFILYGMTQEMKKCGADKKFEDMVLKLWSAYLKKCQAVFISKNQEKIPKLGFRYKLRDARILYNYESNVSSRKKKSKSKVSNTSVSSISSYSKRSLTYQRNKIIAAEYQDHLSLSLQSCSNLLEDGLELLESSNFHTTDESSDSETFVKSFRPMLCKKDYDLLKNSYKSKKDFKRAKGKAIKDIQYLGKNKLLSIIHLALLLTGSQIQLSDMLRFIRESHLSFAKVTHFFPGGLKFPKKDVSYIEVISDANMPTHLHQRKITNQLARFVKVDKILTPNMNSLVDRYCQDLNLPKKIAELSQKILQDRVPPFTAPRGKTPSFEAWAMASVIFVMKLLLGINDKSEIFLSRLARDLNRSRNSNYFVFDDWQKFIESRKIVLTLFHYPTQEQLSRNFFQSSKYFLDTLTKESKDECRKDRFIPYSRYFMDENFLNGVKQMLNALMKPQDIESFEFEPSLTPQTSHLKTIMRNLVGNTDKQPANSGSSNALPEEILNQNFESCDVEFALHPKSFSYFLGEKSESIYSSHESCKKGSNNAFLHDCASNYWIFEYPDRDSGKLWNFKEEILGKTPENFQWLITECARMLETNVRDVYDELLIMELKLSSNVNVLKKLFK